MSSSIAIHAQNLSKCYHIYSNPGDRLKQALYPGYLKKIGLATPKFFDEFWALNSIDFEIRKGETVGIIGRNGSGKSTLLQLICGVLNPTNGSIKTKGRIAALLELGSGFNPEFTGRENVYMNATVLGLSTQEIESNFKKIEEFADIGEFIDQPVKTYSSGMMVRLAFAVIAHVNADILVVDEALAVGDAVFTQKCMRFIRKFMENGTLLFVSHDTNSVLNLCSRVIWLDKGALRQIGKSDEVVKDYLQFTLQEIYGDEVKLNETKPKIETGYISDDNTTKSNGKNVDVVYESHYLIKDNLCDANGWSTGAGQITFVNIRRAENEINDASFQGSELVTLTIRAAIHQFFEKPILGFVVKDKLGQVLFGENTLALGRKSLVMVAEGASIEAQFTFELPMLPNGEYSVMASLADGDIFSNIQHHYLHDAFIIQIASQKIRYGLVGLKFYDVNFGRIT
jgi:lipopolysaccharide transport system ATP-binding protein